MNFSKTLKTLVLFSGLLLSGLSFAADENATDKNGVILGGYDAVSYFKQTAPSKGKPEFQSEYNGAIYHFFSAANRDTFVANPSKYAPQYGGFCAYGATLSKKVGIDPNEYEVIDGKLYVQSGRQALKLWQEDTASSIISADDKWSKIKTISADKL